jgi:hypothetical protein
MVYDCVQNPGEMHTEQNFQVLQQQHPGLAKNQLVQIHREKFQGVVRGNELIYAAERLKMGEFEKDQQQK